MSVDSRLMREEKERAEKIAKRIFEIERHPNFRKVTKGQIKEYIAKVMANKNGPCFDSNSNQSPQEDWKQLPYFIRPCTLFQNTFIISGFHYSCGPENISNNNSSAKINISFDSFEILFRATEYGFELCTVVNKQVTPIGKRIYTSLKEMLNHVSKNDFQTIVDLEKVDSEFRVPLAGLIKQNISMNSVINQFFEANKKRLDHSSAGMNVIWWSDRKLWINNLTKLELKVAAEQQVVETQVFEENEQSKELELAKKLSLELNAAKDEPKEQLQVKEQKKKEEYKQIKEQLQTELQTELQTQLQTELQAQLQNHLKAKYYVKIPITGSLKGIIDDTSNAVLIWFNISIFYAQQERIRLIQEKASSADIKDAIENLEIIKFIYDGFFAATCRNKMEETLHAISGEVPVNLGKVEKIKQIFLDFKLEMMMKQDFNICACCNEIHDALQQKILDNVLQKDNKLAELFDSIHVEYLVAKDKYDNYFKHNKATLYDMEKNRRDMMEQFDNAKINLEKLLRTNATADKVKAASKLCLDLQHSIAGYLSFRVEPVMTELSSAMNEFTCILQKYHQTIKEVKSTIKRIRKSNSNKQSEASKDGIAPKQPEVIIQQLEEIRIKAGIPDIFNGDKEKRDTAYLCMHYAIECSKQLVTTAPQGDITDEIVSQYKREKSSGRKAV